MAKVTTDHRAIRAWAEARRARPVVVRDLRAGSEPGIIRLDFPGYGGGDELEAISWEEFFRKFEEAGLAFAYEERTADGKRSNYNKLIRRRGAEHGS